MAPLVGIAIVMALVVKMSVRTTERAFIVDLLLANVGTRLLLGEAIAFLSPCLIMVFFCTSLLAFVKKLGYDDIKGDLDEW